MGWPPYLKHFKDDIEFFRKDNYLVHVRRMQGRYKNKLYPYAYTDDERKLLAQYMDDGMLKYMHAGVLHKGKLTYSGVHFFVMDSVGNIGYDSNIFMPYTKYRCIFGNLLQENFRPLLLPGPYPGSIEGTVDGIANIIDYGYKELKDNHVESFAMQGGVYKDKNNKVIYSNENKNTNDSKIRAEYNFPPRNLQDYLSIIKYSKTPLFCKSFYNDLYPTARCIVENNPILKRIANKLIRK